MFLKNKSNEIMNRYAKTNRLDEDTMLYSDIGMNGSHKMIIASNNVSTYRLK